LDNAAGGVFQTTPEGRVVIVNRVFVRMFGYESPEEVINMMTDITRQIYANPDDRKIFIGMLKEKGYLRNYECQMRRKDGCIFWGSISARFTETVDNIPCIEGLIIDVSERKQAEEELRESEKRYRDLYDFLPISVYEMDLEANITSANHAIYETFRGTEEDLKQGIKVWQLLSPEDIEKSNKNIQRLIKGEQVLDTEYNLKRLDGTVFPAIVISSVIYSDGKPVGLRGAIVDISERKRAEEKLRESDERYKALFDGSLDLVYITDFEGRFIDANVAALNRLGYTREEIPSLNFASLLSEDQLSSALKTLQDVREHGTEMALMEFRLRHKNGSEVYVETHGSAIMSNGTPVAIQAIARDITERKRAEESLKASENKYRLLADNVNDVIFVLDMNLNYTYVSPSVKILRGYEPEEVLKQPSFETLTPSSWDLAMRTLSGVMERKKSGSREIPISRTLQLEMRRKEGTTVWTEVKFSFIRDEDQRPVGILGVTRDITERKRAEEELQQTLESLRNAIGATIQVMVSAVETRDPYTAGHQLRSADLARAIATEMGLPQEKIDGIRMAGSIHDIGKLSIPAEILSKPKKLSEIEFSLIKEHAQKGYEMLKDVESPWPLAEMVYQHHERMDGSGYPRGLKGDDILMEARILAVADVVEAMASYRPYRPALGIDAALEEIEKNRVTLYDNNVVDACLKLFQEKGHKLLTSKITKEKFYETIL
jgi:PAS domain S-box-containing protein